MEPSDPRSRVRRAIDLPAIAPSVDRTLTSIARRTGLETEEVAGAFREMAEAEPPLVREVRGRSHDSTWILIGPSRMPADPADAGYDS